MLSNADFSKCVRILRIVVFFNILTFGKFRKLKHGLWRYIPYKKVIKN
jgi:hypothetical protein